MLPSFQVINPLTLVSTVFLSDGTYTSIIAAFRVTNGIDDCRVGYLPEGYNIHHEKLEGRLVQVLDIFKESHGTRKRAISTANEGICMAMLIDCHQVVKSNFKLRLQPLLALLLHPQSS